MRLVPLRLRAKSRRRCVAFLLEFVIAFARDAFALGAHVRLVPRCHLCVLTSEIVAMFVAKVANLVSVFLHQTLNLRLEASDGELLHLRRLLLLPLGAGFFPLGALAFELRRERRAQLFLVRRAR